MANKAWARAPELVKPTKPTLTDGTRREPWKIELTSRQPTLRSTTVTTSDGFLTLEPLGIIKKPNRKERRQKRVEVRLHVEPSFTSKIKLKYLTGIAGPPGEGTGAIGGRGCE